MPDPLHVLFLCTGNSARSILAEALLSRIGKGRFIAHSAGSRPTGEPNPFALDLLHREGFDTGFARSKSWDEFAAPGAPTLDVVITVCDSAAAEECPFWPRPKGAAQPLTAHWGLPDPAAVTGSDTEKSLAFVLTYRTLQRRITAFCALPLASGEPLATRLKEIGQL